MAEQKQADLWDWLAGRGVALRDWIDARFPLSEFFRTQLTGYYAPKNFNFWYFFGSLALLVLVNQIITGIWLTMNYKPSAAAAFASVEYIMRDVEWGWLIRYMHSTGASFFFIVVYLHMFRGLMYGSYKAPRELLWVFGALIYLCLMGEAFMGYLLPWGQMSYWGAQVIISLFGTVPGIGPDLAEWIRGDYYISDITLNRFFALHVIALPLLLLLLVVFHLVALRQVGSNNPDGVEIKKKLGPDGHPLDGIPFHPYYITKDVVGVAAFCMLFAIVIFFAPEGGGYFLEPPNFEPADPLKTPEHIAPVWYFTPYYAMLRAIPPIGVSQFPGVAVMGLAVLILMFLPWIDRHPVKSVRYRGPLFRALLMIFAATFIVLGWLGVQPATPAYSEVALRLSELYFGFFVVLWAYSKPRGATQMHVLTLVSLAFVLGVDLARWFAGGLNQFQWILMTLPLAYSFAFMQLPIHTRLNDPLPVPERVTK